MRFAKADDDESAREWVLDEATCGGAPVATASARTPSTRPLSTTALLVFARDKAAAGVGFDVEESGGRLRPNSRCTMRSHLRLRSRSSDS
jgi:hypothetical protein